jgi:hypothetical protein
MSLSIFDASIPIFQHNLTNLSSILEKAVAFCEARKIDPALLAASRLFPDMFPLSRQVQIACDHAKGASQRLASVEVTPIQDNEVTITDLINRIATTQKVVSSIGRDQLTGAEDRQVTLKLRGADVTMPGQKYLFYLALPNFFFHMTTAYDILRHCGVEIGKRDFLG